MKSLEQELRDGNYDIHDVLNDETSELDQRAKH